MGDDKRSLKLVQGDGQAVELGMTTPQDRSGVRCSLTEILTGIALRPSRLSTTRAQDHSTQRTAKRGKVNGRGVGGDDDVLPKCTQLRVVNKKCINVLFSVRVMKAFLSSQIVGAFGSMGSLYPKIVRRILLR